MDVLALGLLVAIAIALWAAFEVIAQWRSR